MSNKEIISCLEKLAIHCHNMINEGATDCIWRSGTEVLDEVIERVRSECSGSDAAEIIRRLLEKEGLNQNELAEKMGTKRQNVSQMLNRNKNDMRFDSLSKMVETLSYEIIVRKK